MKNNLPSEKLSGVWSATPTPLNDDKTIDTVAVKRLVEHHLRLGINGLFLGGTCGEGPFMPNKQRRTLVQTAAACAKGRLLLALQVSDNSTERILDNIREAKEDGADIAIIAPPFFFMNATPGRMLSLYRDAIRTSELPVGIYDLGRNRGLLIPNEILETIMREPKVILVKDSSTDPTRRDIQLAARRKRPGLRLFTGDEFRCADYLKAGYDGGMLGGGIFNGYLARQILDAVRAGNIRKADQLQGRMNRLMYAVYGGKKIRCWLTGLKYLLVAMGIFRTRASYLDYPMTPSCREAIARALRKDRSVLLP
jgi:dihydrodipicolinate synthase/N-acetylneuraminate lyase